MAAQRSRLLVGCYRIGEAADSEVYATALVAMLSNYPEAVVMRVTDPRTGLAGRSQWLPTIFEVRLACEGEMKPIYDQQRREQTAARLAKVTDMRGDERSGRLSFEQLKAKYPDLIGHSGPRRGARPLTDGEKAKILADLEARKAELRSPIEDSPYLRAQAELRAKANADE